MKKTTICKRFVSIILTFSFILVAVSAIPVNAGAKTETSGVKTRIEELASVYSQGTYFTSTGNPVYSCGSSGCCLNNIPSRKSADGSVTLPSGASVAAVTGYAYSCCAFTTYAFYYIFGQHFKKCPTVPLNEVKIGDALLMYSGYGPHYAIYLGQDKDYYYLYNSNGYAPLNNKVGYYQAFRKSSWRIASVYRATNYETIDKTGADKTAPIVTEAEISEESASGYKITFKATDENEISGARIVSFSTDNPEVKNEISAKCVKKQDGIYTFEGYVSASSLGYDSGTYVSKIYATDIAENESEAYVVNTSVPSFVSNVNITNVSSKGYTVTCFLNETDSIAGVQFPTWRENDEENGLEKDWKTNPKYSGTVNGNIVTYKVSVDNFGGRDGAYETDIYLFDDKGNAIAVDSLKAYISGKISESDINGDGVCDIVDVLLAKTDANADIDTDIVNKSLMTKIIAG